MPCPHPSRQRGAATLAVVLMLLFTMMLAAAYASRSLVIEHQSAAHQYRQTQAFEAAEAGLEWALAQLNGLRVDERCEPTADPAAAPFRERVLRIADAETGRFEPAPDATLVGAPACVRGDAGAWSCTCPSQGLQRPASDGGLRPAFQLRFAGVAAAAAGDVPPGLTRIEAEGCAATGRDAACDQAAGDAGHAIASLQAALVPALASVPTATLSATGRIDTRSAAVGLYNTDPRGSGLAAHAGGAVLADAARLGGPPGTPAASARLEHDAVLAARSFEQLVRVHLGMPSGRFQQLPGVRRLACSGDCSAAARAALQAGARMLWVTGDATLAGLEIGRAEAPVLLVVDGALQLEGAVHFTGALFSRSLQWQGGAPGSAWLRGAAVVGGDASLDGTPDLLYDAPALNTLHVSTGTFVRVPGSWKDAS